MLAAPVLHSHSHAVHAVACGNGLLFPAGEFHLVKQITRSAEFIHDKQDVSNVHRDRAVDLWIEVEIIAESPTGRRWSRMRRRGSTAR